MIEELQKHQQKLKDNMATSKETLQKQRQRKKNLKKLIYDCVQLIQDHSALKEKLGEFKRIQKREDQISKEIEEEYKAQIEYLEKNIEEFNRNIKRDIELQKVIFFVCLNFLKSWNKFFWVLRLVFSSKIRNLQKSNSTEKIFYY